MGVPAADRYCRMMDTDEVTRFEFTTPPLELASDFSILCDEAIALMARGAPELAGEFRVLSAKSFSLQGNQPINDGLRGASSFLLSGERFSSTRGLIISLTSLIETLAHESAHSLCLG